MEWVMTIADHWSLDCTQAARSQAGDSICMEFEEEIMRPEGELAPTHKLVHERQSTHNTVYIYQRFHQSELGKGGQSCDLLRLRERGLVGALVGPPL